MNILSGYDDLGSLDYIDTEGLYQERVAYLEVALPQAHQQVATTFDSKVEEVLVSTGLINQTSIQGNVKVYNKALLYITIGAVGVGIILLINILSNKKK